MYFHDEIGNFVYDIFMKQPNIFCNFLDDFKPLGDQFMSLIKNFKLIKQVVEYKLDNFDIFHFAGPLYQFLNRPKKTFLLMLSNSNRKVVLYIFQLSIKHFKLIQMFEGIRERK